MGLSGETAIITGASSGIGEATARALADEGCSVVLAARRADRLEALVEDIGGDSSVAVPTDVTEESDIDRMVEVARDSFGGIDILVNNAGICILETVAGADRSDFRRQVEVNLLGTMNVTHAVLSELLDDGGGDILTVSSVAAQNPIRGYGAYTATKCGVDGFMRALREEVADEDVRITVIEPGAVDTEILEIDDILRVLDESDLGETVLEPEDVAETIIFALTRPDHVSTIRHTVTESPPTTLFR